MAQVQESIVNVKDERRFLLKRLMDLDRDLAIELNKKQNQNDGTTQSTRKPYKKRTKKKNAETKQAESSDSPSLPLDLGLLQILSVGHINADRLNYHAENGIYPSGYVATRKFAHIKDKDETCIYTCRIIENGDVPRFEIIPECDADFIIAGPTPDLCHAALIQTINENTEQNNELCPQGEWFFGLTHPTVIQMIRNDPTIDKSVKFQGINGNSSSDGPISLSSWNFGTSKTDMNMSSYHSVLEVKEEPPDELF